MSSPPQEAPSARSPKTRQPHRIEGGTPQASRMAVVILEVLAGMRTPMEAAALLGVGPPRYYQLETRALQGLVRALEPRPQGKQPSLEGRLAQLERTLAESRRECARQQALFRAAQRSLGIKAPSPGEVKPPEKDRRGRRRRRPTVRALKAARTLAAQARAAEVDGVQPELSSAAPPAAAGGAPVIEQGASR